MLRSRQLGEFVERQGGADDQLYGGNRVTPRMEAEIALRTEAGRNDYRFALVHAHPDRFVFTEEAFRFSRSWFSKGGTLATRAQRPVGSGDRETSLRPYRRQA